MLLHSVSSPNAVDILPAKFRSIRQSLIPAYGLLAVSESRMERRNRPLPLNVSGTNRREWLKPRLSLNQTTTLPQPLDEDAAACRRAGIPGIGLWRPKVAEFGEERARDLLAETGLRVTSLSWAGGFTGQHGYSWEDALADARDAVQLAGRLNARALCVLSGARLKHLKNYARSLVVDALRELAHEAEDCNVDLALQPMHRTFHNWTFLHSLDAALDVVQRCRHRRVKLAVDVYQLAWDEAFLKRLAECVPQVALVQLSDGNRPPQSRHERCLPGEGRLPLAELIDTLFLRRYTGAFELAVWSDQLWVSGREFLPFDWRRQLDLLCGA